MAVLLASLAVAAELALLPFVRRDNTVVRRLIIAMSVAATLRYYFWRLTSTLPHFDWSVQSIVAYAFCLSEVFIGIGSMQSAWIVGRTLSRSGEADHNRNWWEPQRPRISALIPTYNESPDILRRTIVGVKALEYANYDIWVLDDGNREWLRDLCQHLCVNYLARQTNKDYKSGNLNNALHVLSCSENPPEYVAVFDADFVPRTQFLERVLSLMHDPKVAVVQTPQFYFNPDPFQYAFDARAQWPDDTRVYFEARLPCADAHGAAECCGTSFLARCSALEAIGGFATDAITEDTLTSIRLHRAGFKTVYLDEQLSSGLATESLSEYLGQRARWCVGNLQISLGPWGSVVRATNPLSRAWALLNAFRWPLYSMLELAWFALPILFFFAGFALVQTTTTDLLDHVTPVIVIGFAMSWLEKGAFLPIISEAPQLIAGFAVIPAALRAVRGPKRHAFRVTGKGRIRDGFFVYWSILGPLAVLLVLLVCALLYSLSSHAHGFGGDSQSWIYVFALYKILTLIIACGVCIERPKYRRAERFPVQFAAEIETTHALFVSGIVVDVSESGCAISSEFPLEIGAGCRIRLPGYGTFHAHVVRRTHNGFFGLAFDLNDEQYAAMVKGLYCSGATIGFARDWNFANALRPILRALSGAHLGPKVQTDQLIQTKSGPKPCLETPTTSA